MNKFQGIEECDAEVSCADCDWRLRIIGMDEAAVRRAVTVALSDHRRAYHTTPAPLDGGRDG